MTITRNPYKKTLTPNFLGAKFIYTEKYITTGLLDHIYNKNKLVTKTSVVKYLKAADEYAFIISMIMATTVEDIFIFETIKTDKGKDQKIVTIDQEYSHIFNLWLEKNVKPEHYKSVISLLKDPVDYAKEAEKTHLSDMLLFSGK